MTRVSGNVTDPLGNLAVTVKSVGRGLLSQLLSLAQEREDLRAFIHRNTDPFDMTLADRATWEALFPHGEYIPILVVADVQSTYMMTNQKLPIKKNLQHAFTRHLKEAAPCAISVEISVSTAFA